MKTSYFSNMGRPRAFSTDEKIQDAMTLFWSKGYENTSMQNIVDALQLSRGSLYNTFGDKDQLYLKALDHYIGMTEDIVNQFLLKDDATLQDIKIFLLNNLELGLQDRNGCFACLSASEQGLFNPEIALRSKKFFSLVKNGLLHVLELEEATIRDRLGEEISLDDLAWTLYTILAGFSVLVRGGIDDTILRGIVTTQLTLLGIN